MYEWDKIRAWMDECIADRGDNLEFDSFYLGGKTAMVAAKHLLKPQQLAAWDDTRSLLSFFSRVTSAKYRGFLVTLNPNGVTDYAVESDGVEETA